MNKLCRSAVRAAAALVLAGAAGGAESGKPPQGGPAGDPAPAKAGEAVLLKDSAQWRCYWTWRTAEKEMEAGKYAPVEEYIEPKKTRSGETTYGQFSNYYFAWSPLPPADWMKPDFDDSGWGLWSKIWSFRGDDIGSTRYGTHVSPNLALNCLRARFMVEDPAAVSDLTLSVSYRGGIVAYLNGTEIARGHLPSGKPPDMLAVAENYPRQAYFHSSGKLYQPKDGPMSDDVNVRIRKIENVAVPRGLLRKGANVLALEIHRAPIQQAARVGTSWNTCGLVGVKLAAGRAPGATANVGERPAGLQVWNASVMKLVSCADYGEPFVPARPISISAARNGWFCGQIVVGSDKEMGAVKAEVSDLKAAGNSVIPAAQVEILYNADKGPRRIRPDTVRGAFEQNGLIPAAPEKVVVPENLSTTLKANFGAELPIWLKVHVPKDAAPGDYRGPLKISVGGAPAAEVPVHLDVSGWTLPDPADYQTCVDLIQSPESVALWYKVPLWSDEHFKLMEGSFALMSQTGADTVYLPLITRTNFGNSESMVRWIRKPEGGYGYDFKVFDAYLDLALKHLRPRFVCLYAWDLYMGATGGGGRLGVASKKAGMCGPKVTVVDPKTGALQEAELPEVSSAEARALWKPLFAEIRARLKKRGLEDRMAVGMTDDFTPNPEALDFFCETLPGVPWAQHSHEPDFQIRKPGVTLAFNAGVYIDMFPMPQPWNENRLCGWQRAVPQLVFPRMIGGAVRHYMCPNSHLGVHRWYNEGLLLGNCNGIGRLGVDFWPLIRTKDGMLSINGRYPETSWIQLDLCEATPAILEPGPAGAITTARFENLREGIQECEARIFIEKAITSAQLRPRLGEALVKKCQEVLDERHNIIRAASTAGDWGSSTYGSFRWCEGDPWPGMPKKLFGAAAEVAKALETAK